MPEFMRAKWGCDADAATPFAKIPFRGGTLEVRRCPRKMLEATPDVLRALCEYPHSSAGSWPCAGGTSDQSATYRRAVDLIAAGRAWFESEAVKRG